jgi:hypothetical protein
MSWIRETWNSVVGASQANAPSSTADLAKSDVSSEGSDWRGGMNQYISGVRSSLGGAASDSGFAIIDKVLGRETATSGAASATAFERKEVAYGRGNSVQELAEIESSCSLLSNLSVANASNQPQDDEIWNGWIYRIQHDTEDRFYDSDADELLSFHHLLLSSSAVSITVKRVLECRKDAALDSPAVRFLQSCIVGDGNSKVRVLTELVRLGQVIDGTRTSDKLVSIVCNAISSAIIDTRCEDKLKHVSELMVQVRSREQELKELPPIDLDGRDSDEALRDRVLRSAEMLDRNATMRHLSAVAGSLLEERLRGGGRGDLRVLEEAHEELQHLAEAARADDALARQQAEEAAREREVVEAQRADREAELARAEDALNGALDVLLARKRELEVNRGVLSIRGLSSGPLAVLGSLSCAAGLSGGWSRLPAVALSHTHAPTPAVSGCGGAGQMLRVGMRRSGVCR